MVRLKTKNKKMIYSVVFVKNAVIFVKDTYKNFMTYYQIIYLNTLVSNTLVNKTCSKICQRKKWYIYCDISVVKKILF